MTIERTTVVSDDGKTDQNPHIVQSGNSIRTSILMMDNKTRTAVGDADSRDQAYEAYKKTIADGWRSKLTPKPDSDPDEDASPEADVLRDEAYTSYVRRLSDSWRGEDE